MPSGTTLAIPTGKMGDGDLLRVFVNDIDDFLANAKQLPG